MATNQSPLTPQQQPTVRPTLAEEVHLSDYLTVLLRRRRTFIIAFLAVFIGVVLYTFIMTPVYEATATLYIKDESGRSNKMGELGLLANSNPISAEVEIVKSRTIAENVVRRLHLDWSVKPESNTTLIKLLEFSSTDAKPSYQLHLKDSASYTLTDDKGRELGKGVIGQLLQTTSVSLLVAEFTGKPGDVCKLSIRPFNGVVGGLRGATKVSELGKNTNIIRIAYQNTNPLRAREVVNSLVQAYLDQTVAFKSEEASRTVGFVEEQLKNVRSELDSSEKDLQGYKTSSGVVMLDSEAEQLIKKVSEIEKERAVVSLQKRQLEFALASLKEAERKRTIYTPASNQDPMVSSMSSRLTELEMQKRSLLAENTENHPQVKALQGQIDELQSKIRATFETNLRSLTKQESDIVRRLADYEASLRKLPAAERELARFTRVTKVNANIFTFLLQKQEEARIAQAATISNIKVVDSAITPEGPVKPQKKKNILLGLLVGLMLGVGLAFFHDYMDDTLKDADDAKQLLPWPLLGIIPHIKTDEADGAHTDANLVSYQNPKSVAAEAFRSLRTGLHFASVRKQKKVIIVTSAFSGEGKTTISANLAETFAQTGSRVLLVGGDLRRPTLHKIFGFSNVPGLTELIAGDCELAKIVHHTPMQKLDVLSAGTTPPNPAELLGSERMSVLIAYLIEQYDYIIIDAPPVLAVSDTPILAALCDAMLVVIEAGRVPQKAILRVQEILASVDAPIVGMIVNDKAGKAAGYGSYGSYYGYASIYGEEETPSVSDPLWRTVLNRILRK